MTEAETIPNAEILAEIKRFASQAPDLISLERYCVELLATSFPHYNWVGFYMLDPANHDVLILGPFQGAATDHIRIPVAEGICGAAVSQGETVIVDDVSADSRYLACSIETKSEIVAPIRVRGEIVGEIDIDSHSLAAFGPQDRTLLEGCAAVIGEFLERSNGS